MTGMTATDGATRLDRLSRVDQIWRNEEERNLRRSRLARIVRRLFALALVAGLATLSYAAWALSLRKDKPLGLEPGTIPYLADIHGSWVYPAAVSGAAGLCALLLLVFGVFRRVRRGSHRT